MFSLSHSFCSFSFSFFPADDLRAVGRGLLAPLESTGGVDCVLGSQMGGVETLRSKRLTLQRDQKRKKNQQIFVNGSFLSYSLFPSLSVRDRTDRVVCDCVNLATRLSTPTCHLGLE